MELAFTLLAEHSVIDVVVLLLVLLIGETYAARVRLVLTWLNEIETPTNKADGNELVCN